MWLLNTLLAHQGVLGTFNDGHVTGIQEDNGAVQQFSDNNAWEPISDISAAGAHEPVHRHGPPLTP
jgi:hypothetical protein